MGDVGIVARQERDNTRNMFGWARRILRWEKIPTEVNGLAMATGHRGHERDGEVRADPAK
jgi:hypothetical protein